jgi:hypothetical protein
MLREHVHATRQQLYLDEPARRRGLYQFREMIWYECIIFQLWLVFRSMQVFPMTYTLTQHEKGLFKTVLEDAQGRDVHLP